MTRLRDSAASAGQAACGDSVASAGQAARGVVAPAGRTAEASVGLARHFVTDRRRYNLSVDELVARAADAVRAGVDVIQVRERDLSDGQLAMLVRRIAGSAAGTRTKVMVNDRADVAIATHAAGVHLRGDSLPAARVAALAAASARPGRFVIGRSVHSLADVDAAVTGGGCDYLLFGTVFPSAGKPGGHPVAGLDALRAACARSSLPVIAIGGITGDERAALVRDAGAAGFAAVGLFMGLTPLSERV